MSAIVFERTFKSLGLLCLLGGLTFWLLGWWIDDWIVAERYQLLALGAGYTTVGLSTLLFAFTCEHDNRFLFYLTCAIVAFAIGAVLFLRPYSFVELFESWTALVLGGVLAIGGIVVITVK